MQHLQIGEIIEGRYRAELLLAAGGQANVYRGTHLGLNRPVAIKVLKTNLHPDVLRRMAKRFEQEARLISQLRDPHTITLYDFGKLMSGALFMVFEFIDGVSLKELSDQYGPIAPERVALIMDQTLRSLEEAHAMGVLHRDIKPQNIMVYDHAGRRDQVKLLDFGIAKILREEQTAESLTATNSVVGTPRYLAPELFQDSTASAPSDLYSLGLVAYELLTGRTAVKGATPVDVYRFHMSPEDVKLPNNVPVPPGLRSIIDRLLRKDMRMRYATSTEVIQDLERYKAQAYRAPAQTPTPQAAPDDRARTIPMQAVSAQQPPVSQANTIPMQPVTRRPGDPQRVHPSMEDLDYDADTMHDSPTGMIEADAAARLVRESSKEFLKPNPDDTGDHADPRHTPFGGSQRIAQQGVENSSTMRVDASIVAMSDLFQGGRSGDPYAAKAHHEVEEDEDEIEIASAPTQILTEFPPVQPRGILRRARRQKKRREDSSEDS